MSEIEWRTELKSALQVERLAWSKGDQFEAVVVISGPDYCNIIPNGMPWNCGYYQRLRPDPDSANAMRDLASGDRIRINVRATFEGPLAPGATIVERLRDRVEKYNFGIIPAKVAVLGNIACELMRGNRGRNMKLEEVEGIRRISVPQEECDFEATFPLLSALRMTNVESIRRGAFHVNRLGKFHR